MNKRLTFFICVILSTTACASEEDRPRSHQSGTKSDRSGTQSTQATEKECLLSRNSCDLTCPDLSIIKVKVSSIPTNEHGQDRQAEISSGVVSVFESSRVSPENNKSDDVLKGIKGSLCVNAGGTTITMEPGKVKIDTTR